jgi:hypothetical protein
MMISTGLPELSCEKDLNYIRETLVMIKHKYGFLYEGIKNDRTICFFRFWTNQKRRLLLILKENLMKR